jgi:hypothetical protein
MLTLIMSNHIKSTTHHGMASASQLSYDDHAILTQRPPWRAMSSSGPCMIQTLAASTRQRTPPTAAAGTAAVLQAPAAWIRCCQVHCRESGDYMIGESFHNHCMQMVVRSISLHVGSLSIPCPRPPPQVPAAVLQVLAACGARAAVTVRPIASSLSNGPPPLHSMMNQCFSSVNFLGPPRTARKLSWRHAFAALFSRVQAGGITCIGMRLLVALCWETPLRDIVCARQCFSEWSPQDTRLDQTV